MDKILIDLGANKGQTVKAWKDYEKQDFYDWKIECYEPIKMRWNIEEPNVTLHNELVGTQNGYAEIYQSTTRRQLGSSINKNKIGDLDYDKPILVPEIDLRLILQQYTNEYIVLKMNIEGAEFELIPYLINSGMLSIINELFVAWHGHKIKGFDMEIQNNLDSILKSAMDTKYCILPDPVKRGMNMFQVAVTEAHRRS